MRKITIAFDIDGTLITEHSDKPVANERIRSLLVALASFKNTRIIVWSGGGELYARQVGAAIGINKYVDAYASKEDGITPDLAIDDQHSCELGNINLIVKEK